MKLIHHPYSLVKRNPAASALCFSAAALLLVFAISFVRSEQTVYYYDYANYWIRLHHLSRWFGTEPIGALKQVIYSIRYSEYNDLATVLLLPWQSIAGNSRLAFITGLALTFAFPAVLSFACFFTKLVNDNQQNRQVIFCIGFLGLMISPQLWTPLLYGYVGTGGLVMVFLIWTISLPKPLAEHDYREIMILAGLLCLLVLFRRWYAYWVAGFLLAVTFETAGLSLLRNRFQLKLYLPVLARLSVLGFGSLICFLVVATPIGIQMLTTDYGDIYSGYKYTSDFAGVMRVLHIHFGTMSLLTAAVGCGLMLTKTQLRRPALIMFLQFWISLLLFIRTQDLGTHHYYILIPAVYSFSIYCFYRLLLCTSSIIIRRVISLVVGILLLANFAVMFYPSMKNSFVARSPLFPELRHYPMIRGDLDQLHALLEYFDKLEMETANSIYVLASGRQLNFTILYNLCAYGEKSYEFCEGIAITNDIDKRDGFPFHFFDAQYVITTNPLQYHLPDKNDQLVVSILRSRLISGQGIGAQYQLVNQRFLLDKEVEVLLYRKISDRYNEDSLDDLEALLVARYPHLAEKFTFTPELLNKLTGGTH
ncbi:MAG: hypothetical protein D6B25_07375 [Desulfobulbaceae bacterium]|nr:MAG: hypothetical protein D6B25_07375 [Desulfobulbaceae bacterium]